jgi:hypothetical protein
VTVAAVSDTSVTYRVAASAKRMAQLLTVLDREHTAEETHATLRAVRHEVRTIAALMPDTSQPRNRASAELRALRPRRNYLRHRLLSALASAGSLGMNANELAAETATAACVVRSRIAEMRRMGWVEPVSATRSEESGRLRVGWMLTSAGSTWLSELDAGQLEMDLA